MGSRKFRIGIFASSQSLIERIKVLTVNQNDNITISAQGLDDAIPIGLAQIHGLEYVEIRTSDEDIAATIENANSVARSNREQRTITRRYRSIIDAASDGIIATDERGRVTILNTAAKRLPATGEQETVGAPMDRLLPCCPLSQVLRSRRPIHDQLDQVKGTPCIFNHFPVLLDREIMDRSPFLQEYRRATSQYQPHYIMAQNQESRA